MFKKNVFENFQKVALNITVMDDISQQITCDQLKKKSSYLDCAILML
jgi:hypothetical protein